MNSIKDIDFGFADAAVEMERNPQNFSQSFFDPNHYLQELTTGNRFIICGKKGDGKTAYAMKLQDLQQTYPNIKVYNRSLNNFNNKTFSEIKTYNDLGGNPYISFWKCVLMIETVRMLNEFRPDIQAEKYIDIFDALNSEGFLERQSDISITVSRLIETETSINLRILGHGKKRGYTKVLQGAEQIYSVIRNAIADLYFDEKFYFVIDGLDDILQNTEFRQEIITGLLRAADEINRIMNKKTLSLKIVILIRTDVLDICRDPNLSKIVRDSAIKLSWRIDGNTFDSDLLQLVKKRFEVGWKIEIDMEQVWNQIFPAYMHDGKLSIDYVLENIIYRPRDILQLLTEVQKECKNDDGLTEEQVQAVLYNFSEEYFRAAMLDELTGFFPNEAVTALPEILSQLGNKYFYAADFYKACESRIEFQNVNPKDILEKLFKDGYIGQHRKRDGREFTVFRYRNNRENFDEKDECIIHRGLQRTLTVI